MYRNGINQRWIPIGIFNILYHKHRIARTTGITLAFSGNALDEPTFCHAGLQSGFDLSTSLL